MSSSAKPEDFAAASMLSNCARLPAAASKHEVLADPERPESAKLESAGAEVAARMRFIHGFSIGPGVNFGTTTETGSKDEEFSDTGAEFEAKGVLCANVLSAWRF